MDDSLNQRTFDAIVGMIRSRDWSDLWPLEGELTLWLLAFLLVGVYAWLRHLWRMATVRKQFKRWAEDLATHAPPTSVAEQRAMVRRLDGVKGDPEYVMRMLVALRVQVESLDPDPSVLDEFDRMAEARQADMLAKRRRRRRGTA